MFVIIRHNPVTNHFYVHSDGQNDMGFTSQALAQTEVDRIESFGSQHGATILSGLKKARQGRLYCKMRGAGEGHEDALVAARAGGRS